MEQKAVRRLAEGKLLDSRFLSAKTKSMAAGLALRHSTLPQSVERKMIIRANMAHLFLVREKACKKGTSFFVFYVWCTSCDLANLGSTKEKAKLV